MKTARSQTAAGAARAGFTLLELVLVMVIIGTVLGAASPSLRGFFVSRRTTDTADRIVSLTRLARSTAITRGQTCRLSFDVQERTYALSLRTYGTFERMESELGRRFTVPQDIDLEVYDESGPRRHIDFFPDGRTEPATVRLTDVQGDVVTIRCASPTEPFEIVSAQEDLR